MLRGPSRSPQAAARIISDRGCQWPWLMQVVRGMLVVIPGVGRGVGWKSGAVAAQWCT